ncbi:MAG TPA: alpha/beta fold hydrolase [Candidatus Saccharimonadales bacterium]|nr:alpha/beta fold hydrolase [Candidatus Saccharimonadales bacterium]
MKKALILHGTDGTPNGIWLPWLKTELEGRGYEVWAPQLPDCHTPNRETYNNFLLDGSHDLTNYLVIGHSSGAASTLNLLMDERCPHVKMAVMVGAWAGGKPISGYPADTTKFDHLFPPEGFDFKAIKAKAGKLAFLHGSDDPYCPLEQAQYLAKELNAPITVVPNGHHLGAGFTELPELWQILAPNL